MKININDNVRVRLTDYGKEILRRNFYAWNTDFPQAFKEFALPKEDSEGWSLWQIWCLMETFCKFMPLGGEVPFHTEIEIADYP